MDKAQLPITLQTKIADSRFQGGHQTLPIAGPTEQDISIQCSEGDIMSQMEQRENIVHEIFGVVLGQTISPPHIRFPEKPKMHLALK